VTGVATQRITIAKIAGQAAPAVRARFAEWSVARKVQEPGSCSPEQWSDDCCRAMDAFAVGLRSEGNVPPVVYFSEHVDTWLMGDFWNLLPAGGDPCFVCGNKFQLACYSLADEDALQKVLEESLRPKTSRKQPQEYHWFRARLLEAVRAWRPLVEGGLLVILREVLGGTATDEEVQQSLLRTPPWISPG
jgi:hypothetical protein